MTTSRMRAISLISSITTIPESKVANSFRKFRQRGSFSTSFARGINAAPLTSREFLDLLKQIMVQQLGRNLSGFEIVERGFSELLKPGTLLEVEERGVIRRTVKLQVPRHPMDVSSEQALDWEEVFSIFGLSDAFHQRKVNSVSEGGEP